MAERQKQKHGSDGPLVSLCMIVRDGGAELGRCLASVKGVVDQIVVVDTGSKDDSIAVARSFGAEVIERPWRDDFAEARNHGLELARGRFVLVLDADEALQASDPEGLRQLLLRSDHVAWFMTVLSDLGRDDRLESNILRLWRRSDEVRFRYPIHEQVLPDLERVAAREGRRFALLTDVKISHSGYTPQAIARQNKVERNQRLFDKAKAQYPDEPYVWFKYADFLRGHPSRCAEAAEAAERALLLLQKLPPEQRRRVPFWAELMTVLAAARLDLGRRDEVFAQFEQEPPDLLGAAAYHYVAALAYEAEGRVDDALHQIEACCSARRPVEQTSWRPGIAGPQGEALRARLLLRKGDPVAALSAAERSLALRPGFLAAIQLRAQALVSSARPGDALAFLLKELKVREEARLWQQVGAILGALGRDEEAKKCLARARERKPVAVAE
jgi:tetratricopeptide (TPR) repeat protein